MNNKVNYTFVGFIVLFSSILIIGFIYWLIQPSKQEEMRVYNIHFSESVLGLNRDAPVKFRGIHVGKVTALRISPQDMEKVEVQISILKTTPIKVDTVAKLTAQGITGLSYINLEMGSKLSPMLMKNAGEQYPIIKTTPSFLTNIETSLDDVSSKLSSTLVQTEKLLSDDNQKDISLVLKTTVSLLQKLDKTLDENTIVHIQSSVKNMDAISKKVNMIAPNIDKFIDSSVSWENNISYSFNSIMNSYTGIKSSMTEIKRAISSGEFNIKEISKDVVPTMNNTLIDVQELMLRFDSIMQSYERNPSDILFKEQKLKEGPGE